MPDITLNETVATQPLQKGQPAGSGRVAAAPAAPLGNNADFASAVDIHAVLPPPGTVKAWYLRSVGRELLKRSGVSRRMRWCGSRIARGQDGVGVYARPDRAYGRVSGVCVCGQSVCCPVCAPRIAAFRSAEVAQAFERARNNGWEARLETFTKPHSLDMRPSALLQEFRVFSDLWRSFNNGRRALARETNAEGHHLGREVTWGNSGWHYHHHRLRYDRPGTFEPATARAQWLAVLQGAGFDGPGLEEHAYDCGNVEDQAGAVYCAKLSTAVEAQARAIGSEIASSATKGRNLNSLLADYSRGDLQASAIWVNGVSCITSTKVSSVRWSPGLRWKLGMDCDAKADETIAQEEVLATDEFLGALNPYQWRVILEHKAEFALCVAANQGVDAVQNFLSGLKVGQLNDEDPRLAWRQTTNEEKKES